MSTTSVAQGCDAAEIPGTRIVASIQQDISGKVNSQCEAEGANWPDQWGDTPWSDWGDNWSQMAPL